MALPHAWAHGAAKACLICGVTAQAPFCLLGSGPLPLCLRPLPVAGRCSCALDFSAAPSRSCGKARTPLKSRPYLWNHSVSSALQRLHRTTVQPYRMIAPPHVCCRQACYPNCTKTDLGACLGCWQRVSVTGSVISCRKAGVRIHCPCLPALPVCACHLRQPCNRGSLASAAPLVQHRPAVFGRAKVL